MDETTHGSVDKRIAGMSRLPRSDEAHIFLGTDLIKRAIHIIHFKLRLRFKFLDEVAAPPEARDKCLMCSGGLFTSEKSMIRVIELTR